MHASTRTDSIRVDQIHYGRSAEAREKAELALGYRPTGHEAFLKHLEGSGAPVVLKLMTGAEVTGSIKASDRQTISIRENVGNKGAYLTHVVFKHAIAEFQPMISIAKEAH